MYLHALLRIPLIIHSSESRSSFISHMESLLNQVLNPKDMVSNDFIYKAGAMNRPTREASADDLITLCR